MRLLKQSLAMTLCAAGMAFMAQGDDWGNVGRYEAANKELIARGAIPNRVVFIGNSITDNWAWTRPEFFTSNNFVGRGIGGQTSYQFLVRFREDVVNLSPEAVVINVATNDIAENTCPYDEDRSFGNLLSMIEIAQANGIKVILSTVLPAKEFGWNPAIVDAPEKIQRLNKRIAAYASEHNLPMIDYFSALVADDGISLKAEYSPDGVHPNDNGYEVMESIVLSMLRPGKP